MEITEIRVFLKDGQDKKLRAYATVTFDHCFVVRNIKVINSANGSFMAMPSRKMKFSCPKCNFKNDAGSKFCSHCGAKLPAQDVVKQPRDAKADHRDIAHPVTKEFREYLQNKVLEAYEQQVAKGESSPHEPGDLADDDVL